MSKLRDIDVRRALHEVMLETHQAEPDTLVLHEMGLVHGNSRVDVAVINGSIHGYEIKSDRDTLRRLPRQVERYCKVLDLATMVVGECHAEKVSELVPEWWGIWIAVGQVGGPVEFEEWRPARENPATDPLAVARLLWRDEALQMLEQLGEAQGVRSKSKRHVYARLMEVKSGQALFDAVREQLKVRYLEGNWSLSGAAI